MTRLLHIEWLKLKNSRAFWVLIILYYLALIVVCTGVMGIFYWLESEGVKFKGITPTIIPFYDFPDIWHNITYLASFIKIFLAFIVIISITNDHGYRTIRQHVIDGLDRKEYLFSKVYSIAAFSVLNTLFILVIGLVMGFIFSSTKDIASIFFYSEFLLAHALEVFTYLMFAFLIGMLLKKAGFAIVLLGIYSLILEPIMSISFPDHIQPYINVLLPVTSINQLIQFPFKRYIFMEIQDYVALKDWLIVSGWAILLVYLSYLTVKKKDL